MKNLERVLKALASRRRLQILAYLKQVEHASVADIAREIRLSFKATSKHLLILTSADILDREQKGLQAIYILGQSLHKTVKQVLSLL